MKVVLKIGGSILYKDNFDLNVKLIQAYIDTIQELLTKGHEVAVIVGGGKLARVFIQASEKLGQSKGYQDLMGIEASRMNAMLLIAGLKDKAFRLVPRSFDEVSYALSSGKVLVTGGLQPGQSTNAVAALIAEFFEADILINLSNVEKVYSQDPKIYPEAEAYDRITIKKLLEILQSNEEKPGKYDLFDRVGCEIIKRSRIKLTFTDGSKPKNIKKILNGENIGTIVE